jgi:sterol 14alpha-demethylase
MKAKGPLGLIAAGYKKHGECFRIKVGPKGFTFMIGHKANQKLFMAKDEELSQKEVYHFTIPVFGKGIVYDAEPNIMHQQLKFTGEGLKGFVMRTHCRKIVEEAEQFFDEKWGDEGEIDLQSTFAELIIYTAARCLLGPEIRQNVHAGFAKYYEELNGGVTHLSVFWPNAPTEQHRIRDNARKEIVKIFREVITQRRANPKRAEEKEHDFLQILIDAKYRNGKELTVEEISGLLLAALFAGQHTSSITSTWMGFMLLNDKAKVEPKILEEQKAVMAKYNDTITFEALEEMEYLHCCMKETLRMFPPLVLLMRMVKKSQKFNDMVIPKGDIIVACPPVSHRIESVFPEPNKYDPDRFHVRNEGSQKHDFIAFGQGRHKCLGTHFAFLQVKTIFSLLFRKYDMELVTPGTEPIVDYNSIVAGPGNDTRIRYKRRN